MRPLWPMLLLLTASPLAGCLGPGEDADVLATFYPMRYLADQIAGDIVSVGTLIPGGQEPHDWEPSVREVARLGAARLVLAQSVEFEPWLAPLVDGLGAGAPQVVYTAEHVAADEHDDHEKEADGAHDDGHEDPHTWLDPLLLREQAHAAHDGLAATFPDHAPTFAANAQALDERIVQVHEAYGSRLESCRTRHFVTQHEAFALLAHRYNLTLHSVQGLAPEAEPDPATLDQVIRVVREHNLSVVFSEPGANRQIMDTVARETGAVVRSLDPLEAPRAGDWAQRMDDNLAALADALGCA